MFEKEVLEVLKAIDAKLAELIIQQTKTAKIAKQWNEDGVPPKTD